MTDQDILLHTQIKRTAANPTGFEQNGALSHSSAQLDLILASRVMH